MAGSYNHIIDDNGDFLPPEDFSDMIENLGDAYEMAEEMYGMIWWLANSPDSCLDPAAAVEAACQNYKEGLKLAKQTKNKRSPR